MTPESTRLPASGSARRAALACPQLASRVALVFALGLGFSLGAGFGVPLARVPGSGATVMAGEIGFLEDFALAADRERALERLVPGTEDAYFFRALHAQNQGRLDDVDTLLAPWIERHGRTDRVREIELRQALLRFPEAPEKTYQTLITDLGLRFDHRADIPEERRLPGSRVDPALLTEEAWLQRALARHSKTLDGVETHALRRLVGRDLGVERRRKLLERLERPDLPGLARLVVEDLAAERSGGFGSLAIHGRLLLSQLDECLRLDPKLLESESFVGTYLSRLWPSSDVDWRSSAAERLAFLERQESFVRRLPVSFRSLLAHVLFHRLAHDRAQGSRDEARFREYVALPRQARYLPPRFLDRQRHVADLSKDFNSQTRLAPVHDDEELVRDYLLQFLAKASTTGAYRPFFEERYLERAFAEAKILAGAGDPEEWASRLDPESYQALKERVDLDVLPTNPSQFASDARVALDLAVKNVPELLVKIFEIDAGNYYRSRGQEIDTAIDLDGLVAHHERRFEYSEPPAQRVARHFEFPELAGRGTWVIEFIGNGKSSRALVRKGRLSYLSRTTPDGLKLTLLEDGKRVSDAVAWIAGREYTPDDDGEIGIPFSPSPGARKIVLERGALASLDNFEHPGESYSLSAGFYVDRETLLRRGTTRVVVRPLLEVNSTPVSLALLEETELSITSTDLDGVVSTLSVPGFALHLERESSHEFRVPDRLAAISFSLRGKVKNLSQVRDDRLETSASFELNGIDRSQKLEDLFLRRVGGEYTLELRGRTGELLARRPLRVSLRHEGYRDTLDLSLATDASGKVTLGSLPGVVAIQTTDSEGQTRQFFPGHDRATWPTRLTACAGDDLALPWIDASSALAREEISLIETRRGAWVAEHFDRLRIERGRLVLRALPAGDYSLWTASPGRQVTIHVSAGEKREGYSISSYRTLQLSRPEPLAIASLESTGSALSLQLAGHDRFTRVHVLATSFQPEYSAFDALDVTPEPSLDVITQPPVSSLYVVGRDIGEEYRYILERRQRQPFPGNMLRRPGLLLQPWALRETSTDHQDAAAGEEYLKRKSESASSRGSGRGGRPGGRRGEANTLSASLDYLQSPSAVLLNLKPDAEGRLTIDRDLLGEHSTVRVVVASPMATLSREISLDAKDPELRDLRLDLAALPPAKPFTEQREARVLGEGDELVIEDLSSAALEVYDSLAKVHALLASLSGDSTLQTFDFVLAWPGLTREAKLEKYSEFASHELNFFLHEKDPEFFREIVHPYLESKLHKTFLDHWLLGDELGAWLEPWRFSQLNLVERILLTRRVGDAGGARHVRELLELLPPDPERQDHLFASAMARDALAGESAYESLGEEARSAKRRLSRLAVPTVSEAAPAAPGASFGRVGGGAEGRGVDRAKLGAIRDLAAETEGLALMDEKAVDFDADGAIADKEIAAATGGYFAGRMQQAAQRAPLYRPLETTKEWAETNYWRLPIEAQNADLIRVNRFWRDYAAARGESAPFFSSAFPEATGSFAEMMFVLSVLDLPFESSEHPTELAETRLRLTARSPLVVFTREIKSAEPSAEELSVLVSQNFFREGDRFREEGNRRLDRYVRDEFVVHAAYGGHIVITNPSSSREELEVLLQIPRGAIALGGLKPTRAERIVLEPYQTWTSDFLFYFPFAGDFAHYPVQVASGGRTIAAADPFVFHVVETPTKLDTSSWEYISQRGSSEDVFAYLAKANLQRTPLDRLAWRLRDRAFFDRLIAYLAAEHAWSPVLWSYGFHHRDAGVTREYLRHEARIVQRVGRYLDSELLDLDPVERKSYQFKEYWPLVNARAHRLGRERTILNDRFHEQYLDFLEVLAYRPALDADDLLSTTYYLLLQDRIGEALEFFGRVKAGAVSTAIQYDYMAAYLGFYSGKLRESRLIADRHAEHPVLRWQRLFREVTSQLDEIESGAPAGLVDREDRDQKQTLEASREPSIELVTTPEGLQLEHHNLAQVGVHYYEMDIELLFSRKPFVGEVSGPFASIRPNHSQTLELDRAGGRVPLEVPARFRDRNVLIEVEGGGVRRFEPWFANRLSARLSENHGQLRVTEGSSARPLSGVYVKVYARSGNGRVRFYKDGYTDLRGRFDYSSLSTSDLDGVERFALLVHSDEHGALVREVAPPAR